MGIVKIFISHKKEDSDKAKQVYDYITKEWQFDTYLDELDYQISKYNVVDRIVDNLRKSTHLLVLFSEHTIKSMWVPFELGVAYEREQGIGVLIWPDKTNLSYNLPEYLDEFPKLNCNKKNENDYCDPSDLDKYLNVIKKYPNKQILIESIATEEFDSLGFRKTASKVNYAKEFIEKLKYEL